MSRAWYLVCLVPIVICSVIAVVLFMRVVGGIEAMPRFVAPGSHTVELVPGNYVAFGESESKIGSTMYRNDSFSVDCTLTGANNAAVALETHSMKTTYSISDYRGSSLYEFTIHTAGSYRWSCTGADDDKAVIAIGTSVGGGILKSILMLFAGLISGAIFFVLLWRRRGQFVRARRVS